MRSIFTCTNESSTLLDGEYAKVMNAQYCKGDLDQDDNGLISLFLERGLNGPISVMRCCTPNALTFRRDSSHVRNDPGSMFLLWKVRRGRAKVSNSQGSMTISENEMMLQNCTGPLYTQVMVDSRGIHDSFQAVIPTAFLHKFSPALLDVNDVVPSVGGASAILSGLMDLLAEQGHEADHRLGESLSASLCVALENAFDLSSEMSSEQRIIDRLKNFIEDNLSSDLSSRRVSEELNISLRKMFYILKKNNIKLSDLTTRSRICHSKSMLENPFYRNRSIGEVCRMSGFKSLAHFSRSFKQIEGITPREYRRHFAARL